MIVANLATFPARRDGICRIVERLAPQVDRLNLVLNEYDAPIAELERLGNVAQLVPKQDAKDTGKFLPDVTGAKHVFLVDDDILYPKDYVSQTLSRLAALPPRSVVGYHGSIYTKPRFKFRKKAIRTWLDYRKGHIANHRKTFSFYDALDAAVIVDQLGTGVCVVPGEDFPPFDYMRDSQKFVDVRLARWCFERKIPQIVLPKTNRWLDPVRYDDTIYQNFTTSNPENVAKEILTFAYKSPNRGKQPSITNTQPEVT